jgi:hypothetical protein
MKCLEAPFFFENFDRVKFSDGWKLEGENSVLLRKNPATCLSLMISSSVNKIDKVNRIIQAIGIKI